MLYKALLTNEQKRHKHNSILIHNGTLRSLQPNVGSKTTCQQHQQQQCRPSNDADQSSPPPTSCCSVVAQLCQPASLPPHHGPVGRPAGRTATNSNRANTRVGTRRTAEASAHSDHPADDGHGPTVAKRAKTDARSTRVLPVNSSRRREHEQRRRSPSLIMLPAAPLDNNNGTSSQTLGTRVSLDGAITRLVEAEEKRWTRMVRDSILPTASRIDKAFDAFENAIGGFRRAVTDVLTGTFEFVQKTSERHIVALRCIQQQIEEQQKSLI
ncbi:hypothetical protein niasHT_008615 [Heterodera trifolii]|uniref:Uncharacterized protein n=1 Tax=Heterodera trifolii TaxID=157864 RepID=A0ABD2LVX3_9BILA